MAQRMLGASLGHQDWPDRAGRNRTTSGDVTPPLGQHLGVPLVEFGTGGCATRRQAPIGHDRPGHAPSAPRVRGPRGRICPSSGSSWLHPIWELEPPANPERFTQDAITVCTEMAEEPNLHAETHRPFECGTRGLDPLSRDRSSAPSPSSVRKSAQPTRLQKLRLSMAQHTFLVGACIVLDLSD